MQSPALSRRRFTAPVWLTAPFALTLLATTAGAQSTLTFAGKELRTNIGGGSGSVVLDGSRLRMMDGEYQQVPDASAAPAATPLETPLVTAVSRSALTTNTFNLFGAWTTTYTMSFSCAGVSGPCPGDGIAFVVTDGTDTQVGGAGVDQGYGGTSAFARSVAFGVNPFWNWGVFGANGSLDLGNPTAVDHAWESAPLTVTLSYDGAGTLSALFSPVGAGAASSMSAMQIDYAWTAPAWAANARVGFTASSGLASEFSWVDSWSLQPAVTPTPVPEPTSLGLLALALVPLVARARRRA
jgi:hypothetical protein